VLPSWNDAVPRDSTSMRAEAAARAAIALDSTLADPWLVLGSVRREQSRFSEALRFGTTALRLEPSNATAHQWQALTFGAMGAIDSALAEIRRAAALDPLSNTIANNEVALLNIVGDFESAKRAAVRILERDSLHYNARMNLAMTYLFSGHPDSALQLLQVAERVPHTVSGTLGREALAYAALGRWAEAERLRGRIAERRDSLVSELDGVMAAMAFGEHRAATMLLKLGFEKHGGNSSWTLSPSCDPLFASLRDDPDFIALMSAYSMTICKTPVRWSISPRR
jgi:serine/threonine-protein kinase